MSWIGVKLIRLEWWLQITWPFEIIVSESHNVEWISAAIFTSILQASNIGFKVRFFIPISVSGTGTKLFTEVFFNHTKVIRVQRAAEDTTTLGVWLWGKRRKTEINSIHSWNRIECKTTCLFMRHVMMSLTILLRKQHKVVIVCLGLHSLIILLARRHNRSDEWVSASSIFCPFL